MSNPELISKDIDLFYSGTSEEKRLTMGLGPLEFERNKELISRYLNKSGSIIIDAGGGPGIYSEWLANLGHNVQLVDPVAKHIQQAKKRASRLANPFDAVIGEARHLPFPDNFADLAILHGPLYHLQKKDDRITAIKEAYRVLKNNGVLLGFAINYTVSAITGLLNGMIHDEQFYKMCEQELRSGIHNPPANLPGALPEAFFHRPQELKEEVLEGGFTGPRLFAVEGMIWLDGKYFASRSDPKKKEAMMDLVKLTEQDTNLLALSPHMMVAAVR
jgi:SAM-dependent methyltransferase